VRAPVCRLLSAVVLRVADQMVVELSGVAGSSNFPLARMVLNLYLSS